MTTPAEAVAALARLDGIPERVDAAREACTRLRFHEALRRRIPEAAAESRVRGARATAALDGAELPVDQVREVMCGLRQWPDPDPVERAVQAAIRVTAETQHVLRPVFTAPSQALARLHVAAVGGELPAEQVGRPRRPGEDCREFVDLGPAPSAEEARARLDAVVELLRAGPGLPVVVVAAVAHAEIAHARPFVRGNGLVARALERAVVQAGGLDPTGVAVPEAGHLAAGPGYLGALIGYGSQGSAGVRLWLEHCADALVAAAAEGARLSDAVRAGRFG